MVYIKSSIFNLDLLNLDGDQSPGANFTKGRKLSPYIG